MTVIVEIAYLVTLLSSCPMANVPNDSILITVITLQLYIISSPYACMDRRI
jgi:hypothetical protein